MKESKKTKVPAVIGLRSDQAERLRKYKGIGTMILLTALIRYQNGDITIQNEEKTKKCDFVLVPYSARINRKKFTDSQIRMILDAHFSTPIDFSREISKLDGEIENMIKEHSGTFGG